MEVTRDRKLRIPRFLRLREDKQAPACMTDQLITVPPPPHITGEANGKNNLN